MPFQETPTDNYGMPLLVLGPNKRHPFKYTNKHHLWHPNDSLLEDSDADRALRYSIVQRLPRFVHDRYHDRYGGSALPTADSDKFLLTILGRAGYRPQEALNFTGTGPEKIPYDVLNDRRVFIFPDFARKGEDGQDYKTRRTGIFLARYAIAQDVGHLKEIDEFLHTPDEERKLALGVFIIEEAIRVAVDPWVVKYSEAITDHRIARGNRDGPFQVVTRIFRPDFMPDYVEPLEERLLAA